MTLPPLSYSHPECGLQMSQALKDRAFQFTMLPVRHPAFRTYVVSVVMTLLVIQ